jgi:hypothetical protein
MNEPLKSVEVSLLELFGGNPYHARSAVDPTVGDIYYSPVDVGLTEEDLKKHIAGEIVLGSYQLMQGTDQVKWFGWDVDSKDRETSRTISQLIFKHLHGVPYCVEFSGGKGYHILVFLREPIAASKAKKIVDWVRSTEGLASSGESHVECFPKQDHLTKERPKGNLLKIPLGKHPRSGAFSLFVDPLEGWENGKALDPQIILSFRATQEDIESIVKTGPDVETQLVQLITQFWDSGKRHDLSLYLSGFLAHEGWSSDSVKSIMTKICKASGDAEVYNRLQTVDNTFAKYAEGKSIRGRQGLSEMLPNTIMQKLTELASSMSAPDTVNQIDDIRYTKGRPPLDNARVASSTIWTILNDAGSKIFQTDINFAYWYNIENHTVTEEGTEIWRSVLNKQFGLNSQDSFSRLVFNELRLRIVREAPIVPIQNRTFWDEGKEQLLINLGGPEVYILDGEQIEKKYNGECGHMFITNICNKYVEPDFSSDKVDCWDFLVNDLSFTSSSEAPSKPEEQRELLKAWLLAFFFQELMPTKPILSMLGQPGSGKTTAIRRILRIFEDPDADVLGVPTDKQDAFRASIASHRLLVLDNLEKSGTYWMVDILNKLATGNNIELRELYKTNTKHTIIPRCFIACTAVNMPFSDETLFSRLLVLEMQKIANPVAEHIIQNKIRLFGPKIWADLLNKLNVVVKSLKEHKDVSPSSKSRLVDFTVFCEKIKRCGVVDGEELELGLLSMVDSQLRQLKESSQAIMLLEEWISVRASEAADWHTYQELFSILQTVAQAKRLDFKWKNSTGLERHLSTLKTRLEQDFGCEFAEGGFETSSQKETTKLRFRTGV